MHRKRLDDTPKMTRSTKLRKYASVYKSYVRKTEQSKISKSPRKHRHPKDHPKDKKEPKKSKDPKNPKEHKDPKDPKKSKDPKDPKEHKDPKKDTKDPKKSKVLNAYQKFVQVESKKSKYQQLPGKERLSAIANEWKKINKT